MSDYESQIQEAEVRMNAARNGGGNGKGKPQGFTAKTPAAKTSSVHKENATAATNAMTTANQQTSGAIAGHLANVAAYCERVEAQRDNAAEQISDRIAYALDPEIFMTEVMERAAAKLGKSQPDNWGNPFEGLTIEVPRFQSLQGSTAAQLPSSPAS
ncbi:MAG: hypothetical protein MUF49_15105 [Oculatellaceae cyanobacterium Prado106]|jgi:hypothetical protein|nr:hypothetical protein [Oculatellaceae cyanobacterium Prado106]